jgi:hypothetical protein
MLTQDDLIKLAMNTKIAIEVVPSEEEGDRRSKARKIYDAITNGAVMAGGAVTSGIAGINSLDNVAPVKTI